jgi:hypothetical protein
MSTPVSDKKTAHIVDDALLIFNRFCCQQLPLVLKSGEPIRTSVVTLSTLAGNTI